MIRLLSKIQFQLSPVAIKHLAFAIYFATAFIAVQTPDKLNLKLLSYFLLLLTRAAI